MLPYKIVLSHKVGTAHSVVRQIRENSVRAAVQKGRSPLSTMVPNRKKRMAKAPSSVLKQGGMTHEFFTGIQMPVQLPLTAGYRK